MKKIIEIISKNIYIMQMFLLIMFLANGYFVIIVKENDLRGIMIGATLLGVIMGLFTTIISIIEAKQVQKFVIVILDFLLIIIIYTSVYACIYSYNVNSLKITSQGIPYLDLLYYSFVTFTTLGYGDVLPISYFAKFVSASEAFMFACIISIAIINYSDNLKKSLDVYKRSDEK